MMKEIFVRNAKASGNNYVGLFNTETFEKEVTKYFSILWQTTKKFITG